MSLILNIDSPVTISGPVGGEMEIHRVTAKTHPTLVGPPKMQLHQGDSEIEIGFQDFAALVNYWLTNTDLEEDDPRIELIKSIAELKPVEGWAGEGSLRLDVDNSQLADGT